MKAIKLILITLAVALMGATATAQTYDVAFNTDETFRNIYTTNADTISGADTVQKVARIAKPYDYDYTIEFSADTLAADGVCYFLLEGSFNGDNYYPIDTVTWYMSADTTGLISGSSVRYRYLRNSLIGTKTGQKALMGRHSISITKN
jgi:hypothetical protein